jgi:hypothetical protein
MLDSGRRSRPRGRLARLGGRRARRAEVRCARLRRRPCREHDESRQDTVRRMRPRRATCAPRRGTACRVGGAGSPRAASGLVERQARGQATPGPRAKIAQGGGLRHGRAPGELRPHRATQGSQTVPGRGEAPGTAPGPSALRRQWGRTGPGCHGRAASRPRQAVEGARGGARPRRAGGRGPRERRAGARATRRARQP